MTKSFDAMIDYVELVLPGFSGGVLVSGSEFERMKLDKGNDREGLYNVFVNNFHPDSQMQVYINWRTIAWLLVAQDKLGKEDEC